MKLEKQWYCELSGSNHLVCNFQSHRSQIERHWNFFKKELLNDLVEYSSPKNDALNVRRIINFGITMFWVTNWTNQCFFTLFRSKIQFFLDFESKTQDERLKFFWIALKNCNKNRHSAQKLKWWSRIYDRRSNDPKFQDHCI